MSRWIGSLDKLLPSLIVAAGVMLLTAGALVYAPPAPAAEASDSRFSAGDPRFGVAPKASPSSSPAVAGPASIAPTVSPIGIGPSPTPAASATTGTPGGIASRIRIPSLGIDLPVVSGDLVVAANEDLYPLCDVAMYMPTFAQPGESGTTYIYAHAQRGMFLPLLRASLVDAGAGMVGALVEVYTTADELHLYAITAVKPHATDLSIADSGDTEQLVLQTSEGPAGTIPKLQIAARPVSTIPASSSEAEPSAAPRVCLPEA